MGLFSGIGKASGKGGGSGQPKFPKDFEGDLEIEHVEIFRSRQGVNSFIAKLKVDTCTSTGDAAVPVGAVREWFQGMQDTDIAWPEILRFTYAVLGFSPEEGDEKLADEKTREAVLEAACGTEQKFKGRKIHARFFEKLTKKNQKKIVVPIFSPYAPAA